MTIYNMHKIHGKTQVLWLYDVHNLEFSIQLVVACDCYKYCNRKVMSSILISSVFLLFSSSFFYFIVLLFYFHASLLFLSGNSFYYLFSVARLILHQLYFIEHMKEGLHLFTTYHHRRPMIASLTGLINGMKLCLMNIIAGRAPPPSPSPSSSPPSFS